MKIFKESTPEKRNRSDQLQVIKRRIRVGSPANALKTLIEEGGGWKKKRKDRSSKLHWSRDALSSPRARNKKEEVGGGLYKLPFSRSTRHKFPQGKSFLAITSNSRAVGAFAWATLIFLRPFVSSSHSRFPLVFLLFSYSLLGRPLISSSFFRGREISGSGKVVNSSNFSGVQNSWIIFQWQTKWWDTLETLKSSFNVERSP